MFHKCLVSVSHLTSVCHGPPAYAAAAASVQSPFPICSQSYTAGLVSYQPSCKLVKSIHLVSLCLHLGVISEPPCEVLQLKRLLYVTTNHRRSCSIFITFDMENGKFVGGNSNLIDNVSYLRIMYSEKQHHS